MLMYLTSVSVFISLPSPASGTACGVLIKDSIILTTLQRDLHEFMISYIELNYGSSQPLLIQNGLSKEKIEPTIFPTMKYNCFIHFHCNWETYKNTMYSKNPEYENHLNSRGTFIVLQFETNTKLYKGRELVLELTRPHRLFILSISVNYTSSKALVLFSINGTSFSCVLCRDLKPLSTQNDTLKTSIADYQKDWKYSKHHWNYQQDYNLYFKASLWCANQSAVNYFRLPLKSYCEPMHMLYILIANFTSLNISLKMQPYNRFVVPSFETLILGKSQSWYHYTTPMVQSLERSGIIYCLPKNSGQRRSDIWYAIVSSRVWIIFTVTLLLILILDASFPVKKYKLKVFVFKFSNCLWCILRSILRQTVPLKYVYFAVLEIILALILIAYENHVTVELVIVKEPKPYSDLNELYKHNYTFVFPEEASSDAKNWLIQDILKHSQSKFVETDVSMKYTFVDQYFWNQTKENKHAVLEKYAGNMLFKYIRILSKFKFNCHQLHPKHESFEPMTYFYVFDSPLSEYLKAGLSKLHASGIDFLLRRSNKEVKDKRTNERNAYLDTIAIYPARIEAKKALVQNQFSNNMIHLENCVIFLYLAGLILLIALLVLVFEKVEYHFFNIPIDMSQRNKSRLMKLRKRLEKMFGNFYQLVYEHFF